MYVSHVGKIMLSKVPLSAFPEQPPKEVSQFIAPNKYAHIRIDRSGLVWMNDVLAGIYDFGKPISIIKEMFAGHNMELMGTVEYTKEQPNQGGI